jgi:hypothetical protein
MFDLELRFSDQKSKRWDKDFLIEKIRAHESLYLKNSKAINTTVDRINESQSPYTSFE